MPDGRNEPAGETPLSLDTIHELLARRRRRRLLYCLYLHANPMTLSRAAELIATWNHDRSGPDRDERTSGGEDERRHVYHLLYHCHVPKLAEFDVVEYDREEELVELGHNAPSLRPHLELTAEMELGLDAFTLPGGGRSRAGRFGVDIG